MGKDHRGMKAGLPADLRLFVKGLLRKSSGNLIHCTGTCCRSRQRSPYRQTPQLTLVDYVAKGKRHWFRDAFFFISLISRRRGHLTPSIVDGSLKADV